MRVTQLTIVVRILGLTVSDHGSAAAALTETGVAAAIEESKLTRNRAARGIPREAIRFCLRQGQAEWADIDYVAVAQRPVRKWFRQAWLRTRMMPLAPIASLYYHTRMLEELGRELNQLRILKRMQKSSNARLLSLDHHTCHAASAFYASPFDRALILTLDQRGDGLAGSVALGEGNRIRTIRSIPLPHSVGWIYSQVTDLLGFLPDHDEHKTQWLSLYGEPVYRDLFLKMLRSSSDPEPRLDFRYFTRGLAGGIAFADRFYRALGVSSQTELELDESLRGNIAASLQEACRLILTDWAEAWRRRTGARHLCLAGGLFLNVLLVSDLEKGTGFDQVFAQTAAGNEGCALGAAWWVWHQLLNRPRLEPLSDLYRGPSYTYEEIKAVLDNCKLSYHWQDTQTQRIDEVVALLEEGRIVAWYQGAAEFGPRALGHRSLLASPWAPCVKDNVNQFVKHREPYRPFAIAAPEEDFPKYFNCSQLGRLMATVGSVRPEARALLKDLLLPGDRLRLHAVQRITNPLLWHLLKHFGERAPAPFLINTSFNLFGEPLVMTPRDAVRSFFCSGIDALAIGGFLVSKWGDVPSLLRALGQVSPSEPSQA